jgi:ParB family chromosome partitioning protein
MTDTTIPADDGHSDDKDVATPTLGTLEHLNPNDLVLDVNVRNHADVTAEFLASVTEHGVLSPIDAVRHADGTIRVRMGQRRTLAAREAGLASVPVYVRPASGDDEKAQVAQRVAEQIVENDERLALTEADRAKGIQQMLDAGVSVTKTAKKLSISRDIVKAAAAAAGSQAAMDGLDTGQLSLSEAAAITEFDDDPDAVEELLHAAGGRMFDHKVEQLRQNRASALALAEAEASYTAQGYTTIEHSPGWGDITCVALRHLRTPDGEAVTEDAITDPAKWAVRLCEEDGYADRATGELVDENTIDWNTEGEPDATPEEGMRHADSVVDTTVYVPEWFCLDYAGAGLDLTPSLKRFADAGDDASSGEDGDDEAERERAEAAKAEADRRERKKVIALNRLGDAAQLVRREFVKDKLLARKTPPKGAAVFVAECLTRDPRLLDEYHGKEAAAEMLGATDTEGVKKLVAQLGATGDGRAQVITLGLVLGALEARTPKDAWRSADSGWGSYVSAADYLKWLALNGYTLSPVEEVIIGAADSDAVYEDTLRKEDAAA